MILSVYAASWVNHSRLYAELSWDEVIFGAEQHNERDLSLVLQLISQLKLLLFSND